MVRDKLKDKEYFDNRISKKRRLLKETVEEMERGEIAPERINGVKQTIFIPFHIDLCCCLYSAGYPVEEMREDLLKAIDFCYESWDEGQKFVGRKGIRLDQYSFDDFDQILWMMSLGYLLNISDSDFMKLVDVVDRHSVKDFLLEYIIRAKFPQRKPITDECFGTGWALFGSIRKAIAETDKERATELLLQFVTKDWYKDHKKNGWTNRHLSHHEIYVGYWSFETAAVVKIMGLDESKFAKCKYFPKDLILP
jgi:hypothetical protein